MKKSDEKNQTAEIASDVRPRRPVLMPASTKPKEHSRPSKRLFSEHSSEPSGLGVGMHDRLLTVEEVSKLLKVPVSWVYGRTRNRSMDRIPGFRLGKYWRFRETDVLAWLERQKAGD